MVEIQVYNRCKSRDIENGLGNPDFGMLVQHLCGSSRKTVGMAELEMRTSWVDDRLLLCSQSNCISRFHLEGICWSWLSKCCLKWYSNVASYHKLEIGRQPQDVTTWVRRAVRLLETRRSLVQTAPRLYQAAMGYEWLITHVGHCVKIKRRC